MNINCRINFAKNSLKLLWLNVFQSTLLQTSKGKDGSTVPSRFSKFRVITSLWIINHRSVLRSYQCVVSLKSDYTFIWISIFFIQKRYFCLLVIGKSTCALIDLFSLIRSCSYFYFLRYKRVDWNVQHTSFSSPVIEERFYVTIVV